MGGHRIDERLGRQFQRRRRQHFKQEQERRLGSSGAAGPCVRIDPESGQCIGVVQRPDTATAGITHPAPALAVEPVSKREEERKAAQAARARKSRDKKRHEAHGDILVSQWLPRWLRSTMVHRLHWADPSEIDDADEMGKAILEALIRLAKNM